MKPLRLHPEDYRPEGGIDARSQRRTLGRPDLDFFDLFLRETLQNSWDAATGDGPVHFRVDAWRTTESQRHTLDDVVFADSPVAAGPKPLLRSDVDVLVVTDSGTRGLTGPTRADVVAGPTSNFVDLVRNTGRDVRKGFGGGTYGFGKAVLFEASTCATVIVYSRTTVDGAPVTRFIAMNLGDPYEKRGRRYTGRHWWGADGRGMVQPVEGPGAEKLAAALGITGLPAGTTGTSLMVLAPRTDGAPLRDVVARLAEAATSHAWPHMVSTSTRGPNLTFAFTCEAENFTPPDPGTDPRLRHHVEAYRRCEDVLDGNSEPASAWPWTVEEVRSQRPARRLGVLAHRDYPYAPEGNHDAVPAEVALMRTPRLVVRYLPVKPAPSGQATAGVFIAAPDLDEDFAKSEPASHDEWRPENLGLARNERNPVRQAMEQVKGRFRRHTAPLTATQASHHPGTVSLASRLGRLLDGSVAGTDPRIPAHPADRHGDGAPPGGQRGHGDAGSYPAGPSGASGSAGPDRRPGLTGGSAGGPGPADGRPGRRPSGRRPHASVEPTFRIVSVDGATAVEYTAEITVPEGTAGAVVTAHAYVLLDSGRENDPPQGAAVPTVVSWRHELTGESHRGESLTLSGSGTSRWQVTVSQPADTAVTLRLDTVVASA